MTNRNTPISQFLNSPIQLNDIVTFVRQGTNYQVSVNELIKLLGAVGTISSVGEDSGTPILLQPTSLVNQIRKAVAGSGMLIGSSPFNGIKFDWYAENTGAGSNVLVDPDASRAQFRSLIPGNGVNISETNGAIQISVVDAPVSSKTVIVSSESDFPAPISGVINLEPNKDYLLVQDIITSNRFAINGNTTIRAASSQLIDLIYTGAGTLLTAVNSNTKIEGITLSAPQGQLFDISNDGPTGIFQFIEGNVQECDSIGTFNNMFIVRMDAIGWEDIKTNGMAFSGVCFNVDMATAVVFLNGGTFLDLGSALFNELSVSKQVLQPTSDPAATFMKGLPSSGNIIPGGIGACYNNRVSVLTTPLDTVSELDNRFEFDFNTGIPDSMSDGLMSVDGSTAQTVITTPGVKVKMTNVWTEEISSRFTFDSSGRLTFTGERSERLPIDVTATLLMAAGGDRQCELCIAINGVVLNQTCKQATVSGSKAASTSTLWQHEFNTGDYVEIFISNEDNTENIIGQQAIMRIN